MHLGSKVQIVFVGDLLVSYHGGGLLDRRFFCRDRPLDRFAEMRSRKEIVFSFGVCNHRLQPRLAVGAVVFVLGQFVVGLLHDRNNLFNAFGIVQCRHDLCLDLLFRIIRAHFVALLMNGIVDLQLKYALNIPRQLPFFVVVEVGNLLVGHIFVLADQFINPLGNLIPFEKSGTIPTTETAEHHKPFPAMIVSNASTRCTARTVFIG